jgi:hypothetical protein
MVAATVTTNDKDDCDHGHNGTGEKAATIAMVVTMAMVMAVWCGGDSIFVACSLY